jgi:hypothetical protein
MHGKRASIPPDFTIGVSRNRDSTPGWLPRAKKTSGCPRRGKHLEASDEYFAKFHAVPHRTGEEILEGI